MSRQGYAPSLRQALAYFNSGPDVFPRLLTCLLASPSSSQTSSLPPALSPYSTTASSSHPPTRIETDVVISGAGPTGLTMSALLSKLGVKNVVLERNAGLTDHPQAHYINNRTMEILRLLPGLEAQVTARTPPLDTWRKFIYSEELTGKPFGEVDHFLGQPGAHDPRVSPVGVAHLPQHQLLPLILDAATTLASAANTSIPEGPVLFNHGLESFRIPERRAGVHVRAAGGVEVRARFLVAADGAHSKVRQSLGVPLEGYPGLQRLINVYFTSKALGRCLRTTGGMLYFVFHPSTVLVVVAHDLDRGEFVAQIPFFPPIQSPDQFTPDRCAEILRGAAGAEGRAALQEDLQIRSVRPWAMSALVARTFRRGPVFLVGDAAHQFPPAGGFGMNTGIQDAHNLAWKLARVLEDERTGPQEARDGHESERGSSAALLNSFDTERRHVSLCNAALSMRNWNEALRVPQALGLDPRAASLVTSVTAAASAAAGSVLSAAPAVIAGAAERVLQLGLAVGGLRGPLQSVREAHIRSIFRGGQSLRLQFPKEDLGFAYPSALTAATARAQSASEFIDTWRQTPEERARPFVPEVQVGVRFPHVLLDVVGRGEGISTVDLFDLSTTALTLIAVSPSPSSFSRLEALLREHGARLRLMLVDEGAGETGTAQLYDRLAQAQEGVLLCRDRARALRCLPGFREFVLVRPDGHVKWAGKTLDRLAV